MPPPSQLGWDRLRHQFDGHEITFFASRGKWLDYLTLQGDSIGTDNQKVLKDISFTSGGVTNIALCDYDLFLLVGLKLMVPSLDANLSADEMKQSCREALTGSLAVKLAKMIRTVVSAPIYKAHTPRPALLSPAEPNERSRVSYSDSLKLMRQQFDVLTPSF
jgi:hypothetical protein